ncbi:zinc finger protein 3-like [Bufo bufo]|uniref:zinc finger protein 3-like n=1 Tax=Bufo bufo TaxID=8384 RepID=UPI001ABEC747|nr:zinc finger protein 3-like [Bufo bufo]
MAESIINLTLEILFWLTGEEYTVVKKTSSEHCQDPVFEGWGRTQSTVSGPTPHIPIHEKVYRERILELTNKIIELLTGEVPIRCQDVAVYFSMEEWEYLEGQKDMHKHVIMEDHQPPVRSSKSATLVRCPSQLLPQDNSEEHHNVPQYDQLLNNIKAENTYVRSDEQIIEDIPTDNHPDDCTRSSVEHLISSDFKADDWGFTEDTHEEHAIISDIPLDFKSKDLLSDPLDGFRSSDFSQTVKQCVQHQRTDTGEKDFLCSECGKHFSHESHLVIYEKICIGGKTYPCSECGKCFNHKSHLVKHHKIHTGEKPYSCSECEKCFSHKSQLVIHERMHTGEKPYSCSECGKRFSDKSHLGRHKIIHTGEKPYTCLECGKCFNQKSSLVSHQRIHTGERPYSCSECGNSFTRKALLVKHQRIHTVNKSF